MGRILRYYFMAMAGLAGLYYLNHHSMTIASSVTSGAPASGGSESARARRAARATPSTERAAEAPAGHSVDVAALTAQLETLTSRVKKAEEDVYNLREELKSTSSGGASEGAESTRTRASGEEAEPAAARTLSPREARKLKEQEAVARAKSYSVIFAEKPGEHDLGIHFDSQGAVPQEVLWQTGGFNGDKPVDAKKVTLEIVEKIAGKPGEYKKLGKYCTVDGKSINKFSTDDLPRTITFYVDGIDNIDARCIVK